MIYGKRGLLALLGALCILSSTTSAQVGPDDKPGAQFRLKPRTMRFPTPQKRNENREWENSAQSFMFWTKIDHFASDGKSKSFQMRYLVDDTYWDPETGPILFYAGNEGDVYSFYDNTGFMTQTVAKETKGLIVFGEHRYFGVSYPYEPSVAFTPEHNIYLTVEQVMMDYVELVKFIRTEYQMEDKACIVFGGSYGGMLAGWLRMKHPQTFQGALAASAPLVYFRYAPSAPSNAYAEIATKDFSDQLDKSPALIREAFTLMMNSTSDKWTEMSQIFETCTPIANSSDVNHLYQHYSNGYQYMAMTDYPYPASFLEPMPAWPVKEAVKPFANIPTAEEYAEKVARELESELEKAEANNPADERNWIQHKFQDFQDKMSEKIWPADEIIEEVHEIEEEEVGSSGLTDRERQLFTALADSTNVYFNYTGNYPCTNLSDWEGTGDLDGYGWNILACNQLAMPIGFGNDSMFIEQAFDYDEYTKMCQDAYGLTPDYDWALRYFGGFYNEKDFMAVTNTIFSNGQLDPWRAGGLNQNVTTDGTGIALYIEGGAHHLDLRPPNDQDPATVTEARNVEMANIKKWIAEYQNIEL